MDKRRPFKPPSRVNAPPARKPAASKPVAAQPSSKPRQTRAGPPAKRRKSARSSPDLDDPSASHSAASSSSPSPSPDNDEDDNGSTTTARAHSRARQPSPDYILAEISYPNGPDPDANPVAAAGREFVSAADPLVPPKLLTRLLHHHFTDPGGRTRIARDANAVVAKYVDIFVREAVARASAEHTEGGGGGGGSLEARMDNYLEVCIVL